MPYFNVVFGQERPSSVSIRKLELGLFAAEPTYAYEVVRDGGKPSRGTVGYEGAEDFGLLLTVLADYMRNQNP